MVINWKINRRKKTILNMKIPIKKKKLKMVIKHHLRPAARARRIARAPVIPAPFGSDCHARPRTRSSESRISSWVHHG